MDIVFKVLKAYKYNKEHLKINQSSFYIEQQNQKRFLKEGSL